MTDKSILDALNAAGEALKACGEPVIILGFYQAGDYGREADGYSVRIELDGTSGIQGSGKTPADAFKAALNQRALRQAEIEVEAAVRSETEARLGRKLAA